MSKGLAAKNLTLSYGSSTIIRELNLIIPHGKITVLVGSNGCGKSTLLRSLARLLKPRKGCVLLNGKEIAKQSTREVAKQLSILPQSPSAPEGLTVLQLVKQGRYPYQTWTRQWSVEDEAKVNWALQVTQMSALAEHPVDSLSGGQRQRAWIAMTLAQDTDILLLDEPTTYLDLTHQIEILDLLYDLNVQQGRTIIMVLHDLNLACRYAHHIVAIQNQQVYAQGRPEDIVTEQMVEDVFHLKSLITTDPLFGTPLCIPQGKGKNNGKKSLTATGS
ncbi:ABC transporter ATP-binding protein [Lihuaxuella thermophila]|uniref:Iron complex transport system ATP-binding protein n=1 Tax=Lihuaxuella thermophila TaxID=1173111 RepID=A0A1H8J0K5_9BACL|nr:iron complex transport system ATP-binding protein [Lihuaxuella thermophila]